MSARLEAAIAQLTAQNDRTAKQLGELGNSFGQLAEDLILPSVEKLLFEDFGATSFSQNFRARKGGDSLELDAVATKEKEGEPKASWVIEVKRRASVEAVEQLLRHLEQLPKFAPSFRGQELFGVLAAVGVPEAAKQKALKEGIYVLRISDELVRLDVPKGFRPRSYRPRVS